MRQTKKKRSQTIAKLWYDLKKIKGDINKSHQRAQKFKRKTMKSSQKHQEQKPDDY